MNESTLIHWIELLAAGLVALAAAAAAWIRHVQAQHLEGIKHVQAQHLEDLREQLRREQEGDQPPKSRGLKSRQSKDK